MASRKASVTQFDFSGGELPPYKHGRTDDRLHSRSVETALNVIPRPEGPILSRPGTERLFSANTRVGATRMIPLDPVLGQGVLLEFSEGGIRVLQPPAYGIEADPGLVTGAGTGYSEISTAKTIEVSGSGGGTTTFFEANGVYSYYNTVGDVEIYRMYVSATLFYEFSYYIDMSWLSLSFTDRTPYGSIYQVDTSTGTEVRSLLYEYLRDGFSRWYSYYPAIYGLAPTSVHRAVLVESVSGFLDVYSDDEIPDIRYTFSGDTIYLAHDQHPPAILYKDESTLWQFSAIPFTSGPYNPVDPDHRNIQVQITDFSFQVSLYIRGADFSTYTAGDYISYKHNGEYVLATFIDQDGTETNERAIVTPVKSVVTGLDDAARIEIQDTNPAYLHIGTLTGEETVSTDKAVFTNSLEGSWLRLVDITSTGKGVIVNWVQLKTYLGTDIADSGYYYYLGTNPDEVDIFSYETTPGALAEGTDFTEYDQVDGVSVTAYSELSGTLNDTYIESSEDLFSLDVIDGNPGGSDLGRMIQIIIGDDVLSGTIIGDGSNSLVKARVVFDSSLPYEGGDRMANGGVADSWRLGAFYDGNYPAAIGMFSQRLILGGTPTHPETVWSSKIDTYYDFSPVTATNDVLADTAFSLTLGGPRLSKIRWIHSGAQLLVGMEGSLWMVSSTEGIYTATTAHPRKQADLGSILPPVQLGAVLLLVHSSGRQIHQLRYSDQAKSYEIDDGTVVPNHLFQQVGEEIVDIIVQNAPNPIVWLTRADGWLVSVVPTWSDRETIYGLSQHGIGSSITAVVDTLVDEAAADIVDEASEILSADSYNTLLTEGTGSVVATASLYDPATAREHLYLISNWGLIRYVDRISFNYEPATAVDRTRMLYLDSATVRSVDTAKTVWDEFAAYEGETVTVVADGVLIEKNIVFAEGDYTLSTAASQVIVGYSVVSRLSGLSASLTQVAGNTGHQGKILRHTGMSVRLKDTLNLWHGSDLNDMIEENFENNDDILNGDDLHTGDVRLSFHGDRGRNSQYHIEQRDPYPLQILSITEDTEHE